MTPRPHVALEFGGRFPRSSLHGGDSRPPHLEPFRKATHLVNWCGWRRGGPGWRPWHGRHALSWILTLEAAVFLAVLFVVSRASAEPRESAWWLMWLSVPVLVLSWLRRKAQAVSLETDDPSDPASCA